MSKTVVINLFGPPCSGKSTTAAGLYYYLKMRHKHCEMVREYIKSWSWEGRIPNEYDQVYLFGKQAKYESLLYGKVDYIITDSPILMGGFYEHWHDSESIVRNAAMEFMLKAEERGVVYKNFWLPSHENFDNRGRHHDEEQVKKLEPEMLSWLLGTGHNLVQLKNVPLEQRVETILNILDLQY